MTRRARGDGGLHWDEHRQRWIATTTIGYDGRGKRVVRKASGRTRTEAKNKLRDLLRDQADGLTAGVTGYTVRHAVEDWLAHGLGRQSAATVTKYRHLCAKHVLPALGAWKLRDLSAAEVDQWLAELSLSHSTRTVQEIRACLNRSVKRAMARDKVKRNVVELTEVPTGQAGRRSKSLSAEQADDVLTKTTLDRLHSYIVVSLLTRADRGAAGSGLGACPPRPGLRTAVPGSVAIGASSRRYQDPKVAPHPGLSQSLCRRASSPASAAGEGPAGRGGAVDRDRARVHHPARHWHERRQRPP